MKLILNEFSIMSPIEKKAFNEKFSDGINLFIGEKDSGKSTIARSIFYTFGCDVRSFDFINTQPNNIYILDFNVDSDNYLIIRSRLKKSKGKNFFKVVKNKLEVTRYYDTTSFKEFINDIFNIGIVTLDTYNRETKLFPNHIFLPFYTDQDFSWQSYLSSTFTNLKFIKHYKQIVLEYFTGARSNNYYQLKLERNKLKAKLDEENALLKSKEAIVEENIRNIKIIENIDIDSFKSQYNYVIEMYNNILRTEHQIKNELNERIYKQNSFTEMIEELTLSIENIISNELNESCPNCNQRIDKSLEENYMLYLTRENLVNEREKVYMYINELNKEIADYRNKLKSISYEDKELREKLNADATIIALSERADSYALSRVNGRLIKEIDSLKVNILDKESKLEEIEKNLKKLNELNIAQDYKQSMINYFEELNIPFSYNNYYDNNFESVNINLSGTSKVQAHLAQYLAIYELSRKNSSTIAIPMFIDTYLKDDFNQLEVHKTSQFIFNILDNSHQSFVFISNNEQTLTSLQEYEAHRIELKGQRNLLNKDYNTVFNQYEKFILDAETT